MQCLPITIHLRMNPGTLEISKLGVPGVVAQSIGFQSIGFAGFGGVLPKGRLSRASSRMPRRRARGALSAYHKVCVHRRARCWQHSGLGLANGGGGRRAVRVAERGNVSGRSTIQAEDIGAHEGAALPLATAMQALCHPSMTPMMMAEMAAASRNSRT